VWWAEASFRDSCDWNASLKKSKARLHDTANSDTAVAARRRRRPSPSNDQLLDKAFELFVELGYERTSLEAITAAAGLAKRTVYVRYRDKESLFVASLQRAIEQWILPVETLRKVETDDLETTLLAIGRLLLNNVLSPAGMLLLQLTGSVSRQMPEIGAHNVELGTKPTLSYLSRLFARRIGSRPRCFDNADGAAMAFMNLVVSGPANFVSMGVLLDRGSIERYLHSSICLFLHGTRPPDDKTYVALEEENTRLKKLLAETMIQLDIARQPSRHLPGSKTSPVQLNDDTDG
jgi:TetR/AcrR family transcriptional regulator, mexJK operon transcriptional repressor